MKNVLIGILTALLLSNSQANGQCNPDDLINTCIPKQMRGFNYLKSFKVNGMGGSKPKVEYSYVFTKGTHYMINLCTADKNADGIVITLYDSNRNKIGSSKMADKLVTSVVYSCTATGIYYIQYTFEGSSYHCGGSTLSFKRELAVVTKAVVSN